MNDNRHYKTNLFSWALRVIGLFIFMALVTPAFSQNTKGDRPASNREGRFKVPSKKGGQKRKPGKRVSSKKNSVASNAGSYTPRRRAKGGDRPGRPVRPIQRSKPKDGQKAWTGDIAGRRIRATQSPGKSEKTIYPQYGRYGSKPRTSKPTKPVSNKSTLARVKRLQTPARANKFYPQENRYVNNPSKTPRSTQNPASNRGTLSRLKKIQSSPQRTYKKSLNVYANFPRPKRKRERAYEGDISGRPLRRKNYETPRPGVAEPKFKPYAGRRKMGDKPYSGQALGGYRSVSKQRQQAWQGDIAGRRIRGRNFTSKKSVEGQPILPTRRNRDRYGDRPYSGKGPWYRSASRSGETRPGINPLPNRAPGIGASSIGKAQRQTKGYRPLKGGGSVSGRGWNNNGQPLVGRAPKQSGAALFQGNIKARRPDKGGGSVSGKLWNNDGNPVPVRTPKQGGGVALYSGNIKAKRPVKGGESISGKLWNNKEKPIAGKTYDPSSKRVGGYPGRTKKFELQPGFGDQGERFTGYIKLKKFKKNYLQHPDAAEESIKKKRQNKHAFDAEGLQVKVQRRKYVENKNTSEDALRKLEPTKSTKLAGELQVRIKQGDYGRKPHAAEGALPGIKPSKTSVRANEYARSIKRNWDYIRNPSSSDEALKVREPGKAFAKASAYQGNIKMQKFRLFEKNRELHPDTKFIKTNKNNVADEKDLLTNFKLWWARLFKKEETQPDHLKEKGKKPRYDKGEQGMWYE